MAEQQQVERVRDIATPTRLRRPDLGKKPSSNDFSLLVQHMNQLTAVIQNMQQVVVDKTEFNNSVQQLKAGNDDPLRPTGPMEILRKVILTDEQKETARKGADERDKEMKKTFSELWAKFSPFDGNKVQWIPWLMKMEKFLEQWKVPRFRQAINGTNERFYDKWSFMLSTKLNDSFRNVVNFHLKKFDIAAAEDVSYSDLRDFITCYYFTIYEQKELLQWMKKNVQPDQTVIDILMEVEKIAQLIPLGENRGFSVEDKMEILLRRILPNSALQTAIVLQLNYYGNLWERFQEVAIQEERCLCSLKFTFSIPDTEAEQEKAMKMKEENTRCYNCGKLGHRAYQCKEPEKGSKLRKGPFNGKGNSKPWSDNSSERKEPKEGLVPCKICKSRGLHRTNHPWQKCHFVECRKCGGKGHVANECTKKRKDDEKPYGRKQVRFEENTCRR